MSTSNDPRLEDLADRGIEGSFPVRATSRASPTWERIDVAAEASARGSVCGESHLDVRNEGSMTTTLN